MTTPFENGSLAPSAAVPDEESLAFEAAAVVAVTAGLAASLTPVLAGMLTAYGAMRTAGVTTAASARLRGAMVAVLHGLRWRSMAAPLRKVAEEGVALGYRRALPGRERSQRSEFPVPDLDAAVRAQLDEAAALASRLPMRTKRDVEAVVSRAHAALSGAQAAVRGVANGSLNAGVMQAAWTSGRRLIWITEINGCLHCLAQAGYVVEPGEHFPAQRTFADRPMEWAPEGGLLHPPRHPNCRCQVQLYDGPAGPPSEDIRRDDPAARLAGEARRAVLRGWSSYDSDPAKFRAVQRLLAEGANLPVTVEQRARRDLRRRQFSTRHLPRAAGRVG